VQVGEISAESAWAPLERYSNKRFGREPRGARPELPGFIILWLQGILWGTLSRPKLKSSHY